MGMLLNGVNAMQPSGGLFEFGLENSTLRIPAYGWDYQFRSPNGTRDQYGYDCLWPSASIQSGGDPTAGNVLGVENSCAGGGYEPWALGESGNNRYWFITGTCKDANGNILGGAVVKAYRTSDDLEVGVTSSADNGYFQVGTPFFGVAHYLVAYYPGAPDLAGTSVNTLQPSL